jgi:hypothetical protein
MCKEGGGATMEEGKKRAINNCIKQGAGRPYYFMGWGNLSFKLKLLFFH